MSHSIAIIPPLLVVQFPFNSILLPVGWPKTFSVATTLPIDIPDSLMSHHATGKTWASWWWARQLRLGAGEKRTDWTIEPFPSWPFRAVLDFGFCIGYSQEKWTWKKGVGNSISFRRVTTWVGFQSLWILVKPGMGSSLLTNFLP